MENIDAARSCRKVAIVGPESTGKSSLAEALARHYSTLWVPEYAREYLSALDREYVENDLLEIARGQLALEDSLSTTSPGLLFCDTNLLVIKVWSIIRFGRCHPFILDNIQSRYYDLHLLTDTSIPWTFDPQREHPHSREDLWQIYLAELASLGVPFARISGTGAERLSQAIDQVDHLLN